MNLSLQNIPAKERRGSRARCILLTHGERDAVAKRLSDLVTPYGRVSPEHIWAPNGLVAPAEIELGENNAFLSSHQQKEISQWWLAVQHPGAKTPTWDIVSQATVDGREGLILIEAKAHDIELRKEEAGKSLMADASANSCSNHDGIGKCIDEASVGYSLATGLEWHLSRDSHYQMCNRFAWVWKLTTMRIPIVLVYLAFLKADEMKDKGLPFPDHEYWRTLVISQCKSLFPDSVWDHTWSIANIPFTPLIRSTYLRI